MQINKVLFLEFIFLNCNRFYFYRDGNQFNLEPSKIEKIFHRIQNGIDELLGNYKNIIVHVSDVSKIVRLIYACWYVSNRFIVSLLCQREVVNWVGKNNILLRFDGA